MSSHFLKVKCSDCGNEQVVFSRAASRVDCLVCGTTVATPTGGSVVLRAELLGRLD